ncbi:MAG: EamA family transporter RarD [Phycisphaerae bacterium]|nr:EamA family transporter RarD [Phycisphaerae bacterium]
MAGACVEEGRSSARAGVIYGIAAYGWWGLVPIYFKAVSHVPALQVLGHRVVWSVVLLVPLMLWWRRPETVRWVLASRRTMLTLVATSLLIANNWLLFIWSVGNGYVIQASLGYFITPLVNVLLGYLFLGERLRPWQKLSVTLASIGVLAFIVANGEVPGIALLLALSFGIYGLLRKTAAVDGLTGLTIETTMLMPLAVGYLGYCAAVGSGAFIVEGVGGSLLLMAAGIVTALPLLWFANAARRLRLTTMGFLQYLAPTGHFICALTFGEAFTWGHAVTFAFIWAALAVFSADSIRMVRRITNAE